MARRIQVVLEDDINGGTADETITFGLDGVNYEIDLSSRNADRLRSALAPYIEAGRKTASGKKRTSSPQRGSSANRDAEIREWAQANGIAVNSRGRVSADVVAKFEAAQG